MPFLTLDYTTEQGALTLVSIDLCVSSPWSGTECILALNISDGEKTNKPLFLMLEGPFLLCDHGICNFEGEQWGK